MGLQKKDLYMEMKNKLTKEDTANIKRAWGQLGTVGKVCLTDPSKPVEDILELIRNKDSRIIHFNGSIPFENFRMMVMKRTYTEDNLLAFGQEDENLFNLLAESALVRVKDTPSDVFFTNELPVGFSMTICTNDKHQLIFGVGESSDEA